MSDKKYLAWHFAKGDKNGYPMLNHGDGRRIEIGETLSVDCEPELCCCGLHGSIKILDALKYARGGIITRVEIFGRVKKDTDQIVGQHRTCIQYMREKDLEELLRYFARQCALSVADKWDCPDLVYDYLMTGDPDLRVAARDAAGAAAWAAAWDAAGDAARDAVWAAASNAASNAAGDAARDAVWAAANNAAGDAAGDAAWYAAWNAARDGLSQELEDLVLQEMRLVRDIRHTLLNPKEAK